MYIYIYTYIHIYTHIYIYIYICVCVCVCVYLTRAAYPVFRAFLFSCSPQYAWVQCGLGYTLLICVPLKAWLRARMGSLNGHYESRQITLTQRSQSELEWDTVRSPIVCVHPSLQWLYRDTHRPANTTKHGFTCAPILSSVSFSMSPNSSAISSIFWRMSAISASFCARSCA